jgi:hypothetical protein
VGEDGGTLADEADPHHLGSGVAEHLQLGGVVGGLLVEELRLADDVDSVVRRGLLDDRDVSAARVVVEPDDPDLCATVAAAAWIIMSACCSGSKANWKLVGNLSLLPTSLLPARVPPMSPASPT